MNILLSFRLIPHSASEELIFVIFFAKLAFFLVANQMERV